MDRIDIFEYVIKQYGTVSELNYSQVSGHKKSIKFFRSKFKHSAPSIIFLLRLE